VKTIEKLVEVDSGAGKEQQDKIQLMMVLMITTTTSVFASFFYYVIQSYAILRGTDIFPHLIWAPKRSYVKFFDIINTVSLMTYS
jgi:hypothetical protein